MHHWFPLHSWLSSAERRLVLSGLFRGPRMPRKTDRGKQLQKQCLVQFMLCLLPPVYQIAETNSSSNIYLIHVSLHILLHRAVVDATGNAECTLPYPPSFTSPSYISYYPWFSLSLSFSLFLSPLSLSLYIYIYIFFFCSLSLSLSLSVFFSVWCSPSTRQRIRRW